MTALTIRHTDLANGWISIAVEGEIDLATVGELEDVVKEVVGDGDSHLVIDLTATSFMDSTGLKSLLTVDRELSQAGRSFAIAVKPGPVSRLVDLSGVDTLRVVSDVSELAREEPA